MRWCEGSTEETVVIGGSGARQQAYQLDHPGGLALNRNGNLYVTDCWNDRIVKFNMK